MRDYCDVGSSRAVGLGNRVIRWERRGGEDVGIGAIMDAGTSVDAGMGRYSWVYTYHTQFMI